jgi:hypothetical protein
VLTTPSMGKMVGNCGPDFTGALKET